jgi:hypothetical protein
MIRILPAALLLSTIALAQADLVSPRLPQQADQVKRATARLADRTTLDLMRNFRNSRLEIQQALLARQIDASAGLLVEMVRNRRGLPELREVASELTDLAERAPGVSTQIALWRSVRTEIADLNRELRIDTPNRPERPIIGRVSWRGRVDDRVQLVIRGRTVETRTITGSPNPAGAANFTSPLPNVPVEVSVTKVSGRGSVRILQQPARANDFTTVIEIYDNGSGAQEYRLDIFWR